MDSPGPMGKTPYDIAALLDVLREDTPGFPDGGYTSVLPGASLSQFSVAAVDFTEWIFGQDDMKSEASVTKQMVRPLCTR
jgi:amidase